MQPIRNGPNLPERLLQAHEDGRVVFFCGAGISYPAGLPTFSGLVKNIYESLAITPNAVQKAAIKASQFDTAIGLLEREVVGGRKEGLVRKTIASILKPDLGAKNATATHEALLTLGKTRSGKTRLITTNFDRLFEEVIHSKSLSVERFHAPLLPIPKPHSFDGLVYLHGLLSTAPTVSELDRLVVSSGDFGLAYLTNRWAARFVSELFRNYTVCFVGYSINDPVLRYMTDALAADQLMGGASPEMFAFGGFSRASEEEARSSEWRAKNVTPVLYRDRDHHAYLHKTLRAWAETYRDGVRGKERIVIECAISRPLSSTREDDFVGRMLWALGDPDGTPARRFAEIDPVPALEWLEPLCDERFRYIDLNRFGVPPHATADATLAFSLARRPAPYTNSPWMCIVHGGGGGSQWDEVMRQLARWLTRHLNDPSLLHWIIKHGGQLHPEFVMTIEHRLDELAKLERDGNTAKLAEIRANAPHAIPRSQMRTLWRMLLTGRVKSWRRDLDLYQWRGRFERDGLTATLRMELRETLMPLVAMREPFQFPGEEEDSESNRIKSLVEWEIVLSTEHAHHSVNDLRKSDRWNAALPDLLLDFGGLLRDAMDLMRELGGADDRSDHSYVHQPSISEHSQNRDFPDWTALIELTRDAWLATADRSPQQAVLAAETWWSTPYPVFRRLALFAAAQGNIIGTGRALDWLTVDQGWWLWSVESEREAMRLLVALGPRLEGEALLRLEHAVLAGPPRQMYRDDVEPERWNEIENREVWLRLAKLVEGGAVLSAGGQDRLAVLAAQYPRWRLAPNQSDEFPVWMGDAFWEDEESEWRKFVKTPRRRRQLIEWLRQSPTSDDWKEDDWRQRCRDDFVSTAFALYTLAREGEWPTGRWVQAMQAWSEDTLLIRSWRYMAPVLADAPDPVFAELAHGASWWLQSVAKTFEDNEAHFFSLADRILAQESEGDVDADEPVNRAINHPVGHVAEALLRWWYRRPLEDGQGLPAELSRRFTAVCDTRVHRYRHGRVLLSAHVIALFRVDKSWTEQHLLPLFDWQRSEVEARAAWDGYLWSARLYRPMMSSIKAAFLATARHYDSLGQHQGQYASLLTFAALDKGDTFTYPELAAATRALPADGLRETAQTLGRALEGAGDQASDHWTNRVVPYLRFVWPKNQAVASRAIADELARLCIAAKEAFAEALTLLRPWLQPADHPDYLVHLLNQSGLCNSFPAAALDFLSLIVGDQAQWPPGDLRACLDAIRATKPDLVEDQRFIALLEYLRRHGRA